MQAKIILIAILAVLSVALAGVLGYQKLTQPTAITPIVVNQPAATTSDEVAGWKAYKNEDYNYEISFPADWKMMQSLDSSQIGFSRPGSVSGKYFQLSVSVLPLQLYKTKFSWQDRALITVVETKKVNVKETTFQGGPAYTLTGCPDKTIATDSLVYCSKYLWVPHPNLEDILQFTVEGAPYGGEEYKKEMFDIFNQMLSTFKFVK